LYQAEFDSELFIPSSSLREPPQETARDYKCEMDVDLWFHGGVYHGHTRLFVCIQWKLFAGVAMFFKELFAATYVLNTIEPDPFDRSNGSRRILDLAIPFS